MNAHTETACADCARLRQLLVDLREYTGRVEGALAPWILTRDYVQMPGGWQELKPRLDAEIGPAGTAAAKVQAVT